MGRKKRESVGGVWVEMRTLVGGVPAIFFEPYVTAEERRRADQWLEAWGKTPGYLGTQTADAPDGPNSKSEHLGTATLKLTADTTELREVVREEIRDALKDVGRAAARSLGGGSLVS